MVCSFSALFFPTSYAAPHRIMPERLCILSAHFSRKTGVQRDFFEKFALFCNFFSPSLQKSP
jgi:hypothetical protein